MIIQNLGGTALNVSSISVPSPFVVDWSSGRIGAYSSQSVTVSFRPRGTYPQSYSETIIVNSDASSGVNTIACYGTSIAAVADAPIIDAPSSLDFGVVTIGSTGTQMMTISNSGTAQLRITSIDYPSLFVGDWAGGTIEAGANHVVYVSFRPRSTPPQSYLGTITINSNAGSGVSTVRCVGTSASASSCTPTPSTASASISISGSLNFAGVAVGGSASQSMTISNTGTATLTVNSITYPSGFSGAWSGNIGAGNSQVVTVYFTPTIANVAYGGVVIVNSNAVSGTNTISCSGTGVVAVTPIVATVSSCTIGGGGGVGGGGASAGCTPSGSCATTPPKHGYGWLAALLLLFGGAYYLLGEDKDLS